MSSLFAIALTVERRIRYASKSEISIQIRKGVCHGFAKSDSGKKEP
jgi:hypothetical protein